MEKSVIQDFRVHYSLADLIEENVQKNPFSQFNQWFEAAVEIGIKEPNAMFLATVENLRPKGRVVLLKGVEQAGFVFYTNYNSHKGKEIEQNPFASLTFFWDKLERQVRIEGRIEKVSTEISDEYFHSRPRGSQIGAWVSCQSEVISDRNVLEEKLKELSQQFENQDIIPRPPHWGGYILYPDTFEFWQGRPNRLHDRLLFTKHAEEWKIERLSP